MVDVFRNSEAAWALRRSTPSAQNAVATAWRVINEQAAVLARDAGVNGDDRRPAIEILARAGEIKA